MRKYLLKEMAIYDEDEVFSQNAVASVSTEEVQDLEVMTLQYVFTKR